MKFICIYNILFSALVKWHVHDFKNLTSSIILSCSWNINARSKQKVNFTNFLLNLIIFQCGPINECSSFAFIRSSGQILSTEHRTHAASERVNDLWCYQCGTLEDGERCSNLTGNYTAFEHKCTGDKRTCMVMTNDNTDSNVTWLHEPYTGWILSLKIVYLYLN